MGLPDSGIRQIVIPSARRSVGLARDRLTSNGCVFVRPMASTLSPVSMPLAFISSMARSRASLRPDASPAWRIAHGEYPHRGLDMRQIGPGLGQLHFAQLYRSGDFSALPFQRRHGTDIRHGTC